MPSQTELLYDLGLEDSIVGITKFCAHPKHLKDSKTIVGGTKNCNYDKIKALKPTHILCNKEENTKEIVEECLKIASTHVSEIFTIDDTIKLIKNYGNLFNRKKQSKGICEKIETKLEKLQSCIQKEPTKTVAYFIWKKPWMIAANNTYINHILKINKLKNIFNQKERYPEVSIEQMQKNKQPDLVFLSSEPYPFKEKHISEINKIYKNSKIMLVDGEMFSWHGSRLIKALDYFIKLRKSI